MPVCKQCNETFPNRMLINRKWRVMNSRQFCLTCSPFMAHNTKAILYDKTHYTQTGMKICIDCGIEKSKAEFYTTRDKIHGNKCKKCYTIMCVKKQQDMKKRIVAYLGCECIICKYNETMGALSCHHVNPLEKEHDLFRLTTRSWKNIVAELNKCVLLCIRCHHELHNTHLSEHHNNIVQTYYNKPSETGGT